MFSASCGRVLVRAALDFDEVRSNACELYGLQDAGLLNKVFIVGIAPLYRPELR